MGSVSLPQTSVQVRELSPHSAAQREAWNAYIVNRSEATLFHSPAWQDALCASFPYRAHYLIADRDGRTVGIFPLFEVRSLLAGTMLVSVPHGIYGGVVCDDSAAADALLQAARQLARGVRARYIDIRSFDARWPGLPTVQRYVTFVKPLPASPEEVLEELPRKARAEVRRARDRFGLAVRFDDEELPTVWELYSRSMRRLGSPNAPQRFFEQLVKATPGGHLVSVVYAGDRAVAGLLSLVYRDTVLPYYSGSDDAAGEMGANNYLYATLMERAVGLGLRRFDFGRSRVDNKGSYEFKRNQGFEPRPLGYQFDVPDGGAAPNLTPSNPRFDLARRVWRKLPLALTRPLGAWLSASIPG